MPRHGFRWTTKPPAGTPLDLASPRARGLYADWPLAVGGGGSAPDRASGPAGPLVRGGGVGTAWTQPDGAAILMDGFQGYLFSNNPIFDPSATDFTAALWVNQTTNVTAAILAQFNGAGTGRSWLATNATNTALGSFLGGTAVYAPTVAWSFNRWHHVAVTKSGTAITLYQDGVVVLGYTAAVESANGQLLVGVSKSASGYLAGTIGRSGLTLWTRALSAAEVLDLVVDPHALSLGPGSRRLPSPRSIRYLGLGWG